MEFFRQEYWSGLPFLLSGDLPDPGIKLGLPAFLADSLLSEPPGKPKMRFEPMTLRLRVSCSTKWASQAAAKVKFIQLCPTLYDPMDYTAHGILQARILEWVAFPSSRGSSQPKDRTQVLCITGRFLTSGDTREALAYDHVTQQFYSWVYIWEKKTTEVILKDMYPMLTATLFTIAKVQK